MRCVSRLVECWTRRWPCIARPPRWDRPGGARTHDPMSLLASTWPRARRAPASPRRAPTPRLCRRSLFALRNFKPRSYLAEVRSAGIAQLEYYVDGVPVCASYCIPLTQHSQAHGTYFQNTAACISTNRLLVSHLLSLRVFKA